MSMRTAALSGAAVGGLLLLVAWAFDLPLEHVTVLAPLIVVVGGLVAGLVVLWSRVVWESLREAKHPRRIVVLSVAALALLVGLSLLGLKLPREG